MKTLFLILLLPVFFSSNAQTEKKNFALGYFCGYSGSATTVVKNTVTLLYQKDYKGLRKLMYSDSPAENFLGVVLCNKLASDHVLEFDANDLNRIYELMRSQEWVHICSGCTGSSEIKLGDLLHSREGVRAALDYFFGPDSSDRK